jgi:hypothetical protein
MSERGQEGVYEGWSEESLSSAEITRPWCDTGGRGARGRASATFNLQPSSVQREEPKLYAAPIHPMCKSQSLYTAPSHTCPTAQATREMPTRAEKTVKSRPSCVRGVTSPYPTLHTTPGSWMR